MRRRRQWAERSGVVVLVALLGACSAGEPPPPDPAPTPAPDVGEPGAEDTPGEDTRGEEADAATVDAASERVAGPTPAADVPAEEADPGSVATVGRGERRSEAYPRWEGELVRLAAMRLVELEDRDRLVLEFEGALPSWQVAAVEGPVLERPGGAALDLAGERYLEVRLVPGTAIDRDAVEPAAGVDLPAVVASSEPAGIDEAAVTGDVGDVLTVTLGVGGPARAFGVAALEQPDRLVVDVPRGAD